MSEKLFIPPSLCQTSKTLIVKQLLLNYCPLLNKAVRFRTLSFQKKTTIFGHL